MKKQMYVSLWLGNIESRDALEEYTELDYSLEDAPLASPFTEEFGIDTDDIDEDFVERAFSNVSANNLSHHLSCCSYEDAVIPAFQKLLGEYLPKEYNAMILVYDYQYDAANAPANSAFDFIDSVQIGYDD